MGGGGAVVGGVRLEVVSGSGRMQGGAFTLEAQVGQAREQRSIASSGLTLDSAAPVMP